MDTKCLSRRVVVVLLLLLLVSILMTILMIPCCYDVWLTFITNSCTNNNICSYYSRRSITKDIIRYVTLWNHWNRNKTKHDNIMLPSSDTTSTNNNAISSSKAIISTHGLLPSSIATTTSMRREEEEDLFMTARTRFGRILTPPPSYSSSLVQPNNMILDSFSSQQPEDVDATAISEGEPCVGMILQVTSQLATTTTTTEVETISQKDDNRNQQQQSNTELSLVQYYELTERVYDELGLLDEHIIDFAYRPVIPKKQQLQWGVEEGEDMKQIKKKKKKNATTTSSSIIVPPLDSSKTTADNFLLLPYDNNENNNEKKNYYYERVGKSAFAGGSHGEIWKARRRCDLLTRHNKQQYQNQPPCDDQQELIMKRLKVEEGSAIMEAGLREVYFGQLLMPKAAKTTSTLFTTYVDHFFKKISRNAELTELWIVFVDAGMSMRSFLYTPIMSDNGFVVYQNSDFWRKLRVSVASDTSTSKSYDRFSSSSALRTSTSSATVVCKNDHLPYRNKQQQHDNIKNPVYSKNLLLSKINNGRVVMKEVLRQLLTSAAYLHSLGIVHRDIKPSNILCKATPVITTNEENEKSYYNNNFQIYEEPNSTIQCVLGDFSSAWDRVTDERLYSNGLSEKEQTVEYAPPEVLFSGNSNWIPFDPQYPQSYDSWSIGVVALEMLLGTPNVFSVDQRTTAILTHRLKNASTKEVQRALYLAALSQFCIYKPISNDSNSSSNIAPSSRTTQWPFSDGDPLHLTTSVKSTCSLQDFHDALRARDPLGIGFDSSADLLLELIWKLLAWNPSERITPTHALAHEYFKSSTTNNSDFALIRSTQAANSKIIVEDKYPIPTVYICPKCQRRFDNWNSCHQHANSRRHAKFCTYDTSLLPPCLSTHSMLPAHPTSGYCDIRGRRKTIEDFHSIRLHSSHQFYGVFDGHFGNLASKYAASKLYEELFSRLGDLHDIMNEDASWKSHVFDLVATSFEVLHERFLAVAASSPGGVMDQSGTTATVLYVTDSGIVVGNVGDSRAILSVGASYQENSTVGFLPLTVDHIASVPTERDRIESLGGFVSLDKKDSIARVNGTLAVSRSIGDAALAPLLSRTPHVVAYTRKEVLQHCRPSSLPPEGSYNRKTEEFPCFVVVASDGLWDVISNQEVIDMVVEVIRQYYIPGNTFRLEEGGGAFQEAAQRLTQEAYVRGSTDNIGVCVVAINFPFVQT